MSNANPSPSNDEHDSVTPEFVRPAVAVKMFGVGKSTLADWIAKELIRSHLVRRRGNKSGMRLISTESLRGFITKGAG